VWERIQARSTPWHERRARNTVSVDTFRRTRWHFGGRKMIARQAMTFTDREMCSKLAWPSRVTHKGPTRQWTSEIRRENCPRCQSLSCSTARLTSYHIASNTGWFKLALKVLSGLGKGKEIEMKRLQRVPAWKWTVHSHIDRF